jgi:hypothetical protein
MTVYVDVAFGAVIGVFVNRQYLGQVFLDDSDPLVVAFYASLATPPGSTGGLGGTANYILVTSDYAILPTDGIIECFGNITITLPSAVGMVGKSFTIKNVGPGVVTVITTLSQTMDAQLKNNLQSHDSITISSNGVNWLIS